MKKILVILFLASCSSFSSEKQGLTDVNGTSLFYHIIGKGEPVIVIHGGPVLDQSYMIDHFRELAKEYQLIFFDQRACGRSTAEVDTSSMKIKMLVEDIEGIRKRFGYEQVHILGHSWGGMLAAQYAIEYPLKVKSLVLCDAMPPSYRLWQDEEKALSDKLTAYDTVMEEKIKASEGFKSKNVKWVDSLMKFTFRKQFYDSTKLARLKIQLPWDYHKRSAIFFHVAPDLFSYDITGRLDKIISPTLIIYGDQEPATQISLPVYKKGIINSRSAVISKSGHFPFIEQPEQFNETVASFWKKLKED